MTDKWVIHLTDLTNNAFNEKKKLGRQITKDKIESIKIQYSSNTLLYPKKYQFRLTFSITEFVKRHTTEH